jgi:hypothetical protein
MKFNKQLITLWVLATVATIVSTTSSSVSAGTGCLGTGANCNTPTTVTVTINPGDICIGSTGAFNFGQYTVSSIAQTVNGTFSSPFWVDDLRGSNSGYYTTVQMSGVLQGPGASTISATNISMRTTAVGNGGITTMAGSPNTNVVVNAGMSAFQTLNTPRRLIERVNWANFGLIGQYGVTPQMQLVIPAYQAVGSYTGTLVYTLYNSN